MTETGSVAVVTDETASPLLEPRDGDRDGAVTGFSTFLIDPAVELVVL